MAGRDKNDKNIIRHPRRFGFNIGIIVFAFVLIYFLVYLFQYLTETHVSIYEVEMGQIMVRTNYTGLVLRSEDVTYSDESGMVNYYSKEGDKAGYGDLVCSIDQEGSIYEEITAAGTDGPALTMSDLLQVEDLITDFSNDYSADQFYAVYSFGDNLNSEVQENLYLDALDEMGSRADSSSTFSLITADQDGVLAFYTDGYEGVTPENFNPDMYQASDYKKNNLKGSTSVSPGQALYKMVTDENWNIMIPIDEDATSMYRAQMGENDDSFVTQITFKKDEAQVYATASIQDYDGQNFLNLAFNSSMVRYISDRYLEVEIGSGDNTGLKIPNSAITQKEFLVVPSEYMCKDEDSSGLGVIKIFEDKQGDQYAEFVEPEIYFIDEETGDYCIAGEGLSRGDTIQHPESAGRYILNDTVEHDGVYNLNKGYAVFKLIEPISSNGEYSIVETGTTYGLSLYDRIALDGDSIQDGEYAS